MGSADVAGDAFQVGIPCHESAEYLILGFIAGIHGQTIFLISLAVIGFVFPKVVGLNSEKNIDVRQTQGAVVSGLFPAPQKAAEIAVKADSQTFFFCGAHEFENKIRAAFAERWGDPAEMQPVKAFQQSVHINL